MHRGIHTPTLVVLFFLGLLLALGAPPAEAQPMELPGLTSDAVVVLDGEGIPHICGDNQRDTIFLQGYFHARDRFFQMDTLRRTFSGRLGELVGPAALAQDVQFRTLGLRRGAEESWQTYQDRGLDEMVTWLEAYAEGVNAYLAANPLPPEYGALELTSAAPWTPIDSLVIAKGLAFGLSFDLGDIDRTIRASAYSAAGQVLGFDGQALLFDDVNRPAPFDDAISIPDALPRRAGVADLSIPKERTAALARSYRDKVGDMPLLEKAFERHGGDTGSNWWILSGEVTESGHPMLANDPHLGLDVPAIWYEVHLISSIEPACGLDVEGKNADALRFGAGATDEKVILDDNLDANGVSFAGAPGVVLGCSRTACWGATVNPMDVTDVYQEALILEPQTGLPAATLFDGQPEPLEVIPQTYRVNQPGNGTPDDLVDAGVGPAEGGLTFVVPRRNHGPIVEIDTSRIPPIALSVQYTGWRGTTELEAFRRFQQAETVSEFATAVQFFDVGSQNFAYADVHGDIAYFTSAEMPLREDLQTLNAPDGGIPPFLIRDGTHTLRHEWLPVENPQPTQSLDYEILPFSEMPQVVNPARGWVANANNDPIGTTLDNNPLNQLRPGGGLYYLSPGYVSLRMGRIDRLLKEILADGNKADVADMEAIQANNELLDAELVLPHLLEAFGNASAEGAADELRALADDGEIAEAVGRLAEWDFATPTGLAEGYDPDDTPGALDAPDDAEIFDSIAATIWSVFRGQLVEAVIDDTLEGLGLGDHLPGSRLAYAAVAHHLRTFEESQGVGASGVDFFPGPLSPEENRDLVLLGALRDALDLLASDTFADAFGGSTDQDDYRWGKLHRIVFDHPLGGPFSIPPAGGFADVGPGLPGVARAGGYEAVDASSHSARADGVNEFMFGSGASRRFVGVLDPAGIEAQQILPGGQSGVLGSPRYADQLERWLTNEYHPMLLSADDVSAGADAVLFFERPRCMPDDVTLCLQNRRFQVRLDWQPAGGDMQPAQVVPFSSQASGNFYFYDPKNWEFLVKVLDACALNGHFWIFASPATDLGWGLTVEDSVTGAAWAMDHPAGMAAPPITDTTAFDCP